MNRVPLKVMDSLPHLGVDISSSLTWNEYVQNIIKKASRVSGLVKRTLGWHAPQHTKQLLYCSLVRPLLEYCTPLWSGTTRSNIRAIESVQRSMTRYIFNYRDINYKERLVNLNMLPLTMRRELNDITFFWKCLHDMYSVDLSHYVNFSGSNTIHSTRSTTDTAFLMVPPLCRTEGFKRSFFNRIVPLWNSLPHSVRCIENLSTLKHVLKKIMFRALCTDFEIETFDSWFIKCVC